MPDTPTDARSPPMPKEVSTFAGFLLHDLIEEGFRKDVPESLWAEAQELVDAVDGVTLSEPSGPIGNQIRVLTYSKYAQDGGDDN